MTPIPVDPVLSTVLAIVGIVLICWRPRR